MVIEAGTLIGVLTTIIGIIVGLVYWVQKRTKDTEDCVEGQLRTMQESLHKFREDVIDRLARIETKIENGSKKGAGGSHSQ